MHEKTEAVLEKLAAWVEADGEGRNTLSLGRRDKACFCGLPGGGSAGVVQDYLRRGVEERVWLVMYELNVVLQKFLNGAAR